MYCILPCTESDTLRSPGQKEEHPRLWCCSSSDQPGEPGKEKILNVDFVLLKDHISLFCFVFLPRAADQNVCKQSWAVQKLKQKYLLVFLSILLAPVPCNKREYLTHQRPSLSL